jgi:hypothetical protein
LDCNNAEESSSTTKLLMKPLDKVLFPRPSAGYALHKLFHNNNDNAEVLPATSGDCTIIRPMSSNLAEAVFQKSDCADPRSPPSLAAVLQQAKCNGNSLFQSAASSALLSMPGKDFVAIADILRVDLETRPPSKDSPGACEGDDQVGAAPAQNLII